MRKIEFRCLHSLLHEIAEEINENTDRTIQMENYADVDAHPQAIHRSKSDHKEAVDALCADIINSIDKNAHEETTTTEEAIIEFYK